MDITATVQNIKKNLKVETISKIKIAEKINTNLID